MDNEPCRTCRTSRGEGIMSRVEHVERVEVGRDSEPCRTCRTSRGEGIMSRVERVES